MGAFTGLLRVNPCTKHVLFFRLLFVGTAKPTELVETPYPSKYVQKQRTHLQKKRTTKPNPRDESLPGLNVQRHSILLFALKWPSVVRRAGC